MCGKDSDKTHVLAGGNGGALWETPTIPFRS